MAQKIALIGANGQLGTDIQKVFSTTTDFEIIPLSRAEIDITHENTISSVLDSINPDIVLSTAAYHKVDDIENDPHKAIEVNGLGSKNLAMYCGTKEKTLVFFSTDYVFGADSERKEPYQESDIPGPVNLYGISKLMGEYAIGAYCENYYLIRTSGLFGHTGSSGKGGENFVNVMLRLAREKNGIKVVNDQLLTPTYTLDLAQQLVTLLQTNSFGLYHITSEGQCSWYEFAKEIFSLSDISITVEPISSSEYKTPAKRPHYSVLENSRLKNLNINSMRHWKEGLKDYIKEKGNK